MLALVEHFYSIQGEGKYIGKLSLFFRFGGCNMTCKGFACEELTPDGEKILGCDTIYAVNREHFSQNWQSIESSEALLSIVDAYNLPRAVDIVLTGGEPLLYANDLLFIEFLEQLHRRGHTICFETNGSLDVNFEKYPIYKECEFTLSVKLSNSAEKLSKRVNAQSIKNIAKNAKDAYFKFSLSLLDDAEKFLVQEIAEIVSLAPNIDVYCMPLGSSKEEIERGSESLIEFCKEKGYNFSDRLHIRVWNEKKGV